MIMVKCLCCKRNFEQQKKGRKAIFCSNYCQNKKYIEDNLEHVRATIRKNYIDRKERAKLLK